MLPRPSMAGMPNEVLIEIFGHLQVSFNNYHRTNALLGILDPPATSKVWNPVHLQLVCRRWKELARPLFFRDQVTVDCRDQFALRRLANFLKKFDTVSFPRLVVLFVTSESGLNALSALDIVSSSRSRRESPTPLRLLASTPDWETMSDVVTNAAYCVFAPREDDTTRQGLGHPSDCRSLQSSIVSTEILTRTVCSNPTPVPSAWSTQTTFVSS